MKVRKLEPFPESTRILTALGTNIKLARLRRKISSAMLAESANVSRSTVSQIENGASGVSIGAYLQVLFILGMENELANIAAADEVGRTLQDATLLPTSRAPKKGKE